jgi:hypothetical protein
MHRIAFALLLCLLQDPDTRSLGRWRGMYLNEPVEIEARKDCTATVWIRGKREDIRFRFLDAGRVRIDRKDKPSAELSVKWEGSTMALSDARQTLTCSRPPDPGCPVSRSKTPREWLDRRLDAARNKDVQAFWSLCGPAYRKSLAEWMDRFRKRKIEEGSEATRREMGFGRPFEEIQPEEMALWLADASLMALGADWAVKEIQEEAAKATVIVDARVRNRGLIRKTFQLVKDADGWVEDWSAEMEANLELAMRNEMTVVCMNNLQQLWKMAHNFLVQYGGPRKEFSKKTGSGFWLVFREKDTLLIDDELAGIYACPFRRKDWKLGTTFYRGPKSNINTLDIESSVVGACLEHPDGTGIVLLGTGRIVPVKKGDDLWKRVLEETAP